MKIALLNDTHCGIRNNNQMFAEYQGRFYSQIFFPYIDKHNIKTIIHLGDYFDRRRDVNFYSLHKNYEHFVQPMIERDMTMDLIVGNHDIYFKNTNELNSPDYLLDFENIKYFNQSQWAFHLSTAKQIKNFTLGIAAKSLFHNLGGYNGNGFGFDIGAKFSPWINGVLGITFNHFTTSWFIWDNGTVERTLPNISSGLTQLIKLSKIG